MKQIWMNLTKSVLNKDRHKKIHAIRFYLYKVLEQVKLCLKDQMIYFMEESGGSEVRTWDWDDRGSGVR